MKRNDLLSAILDAGLACLMAIAGVGCLATAFSLYVDMSAVALTAAVFSLLAAICTRLRRGWLVLLLAVLGGMWLLYELAFEENFYSVLNQVLSLYNRGYGWGVPEAIVDYDQWDLTLTFQVIAACSALLAGISLTKRIHSLAALAALLPVLPCVVITDTVPSESYLLLVILTLALLAMTHYSRSTDTRQANRLTIMLLIPLLLAGMVLFTCTPQSEYTVPDVSKGMFSLVEQLAEYFPFLQGNGDKTDIAYPTASDKVQLSALGPRPTRYNKVLEVVVSQSGGLYLRGHSYMGYTGLNWEAWPENALLAPPGETYLIEAGQTIQIHTLQTHSLQYFPYYPGKSLSLVDGALINEAGDTYLYSFRPLRSDWKQVWLKQYAGLGVDNSTYAAMQQYTQLPEETARQAMEHLEKAGVNLDGNIIQIAQRIGLYVENSAKYDVNTAAMPEGETDFAIWFLDQADTGYCVHFATAAAVLLRSAGIPARYVEGYLVDAQAGQTTPVRAGHAHAWVEYYVPNVGWVVLEATPGEGLPVPPPTEPTNPTEPTQPTEPTKPTMPTEPTAPTDPTLPTEPTMPTGPTETTGPTEPGQTTQPTEPGQTTQPTVPGETQPVPAPTPPRDFTWLKRLLGWIGMALAVLAALLGQWRLRLALRRKAMDGSGWISVRRRWRYACLLARLCRHGEPKPLLELLKKAKFSRSGLNERELRQFDRYYAACIRGLKRCPWYQRLLLRLVLAAW